MHGVQVAVALYLCIIAAILIVLALISMVTVRIEISLRIENGLNESFLIISTLGGLVRRKLPIALGKGAGLMSPSRTARPSDQGKTAVSPLEIIGLVKDGFIRGQQNARYFNSFKGKARVENFELMARLGTGDAAHTALLCGSLISLLHIALFYLQNNYHLGKKEIGVTPVFEGEVFQLYFNCIIAIKLRYIIIAGIKKTAEKIKGGEKVVRASN